jgi:UDP-N-acetylmuramate: L-alanyl-gamma-D-glutamyl-meso-diaminopimelate ligase
LNAVEFDHADIYRDLAHVKQSFSRLLEILPPTAPLLVCGDFPEAIDVARGSGRAFVTFGEGPVNDWRVEGLADSPSGLRFSAVGAGESIALESPLLGAMNARNLLGTAALAHALGIDREAIQSAAASFHGVRRRQQIVARGAATLIDDFAHHPTAIAATLAAVRSRFPTARVWALFDPRSNTTRRRVFQKEIARSLAIADRIAIGPVHDVSRIEASERFSPEEAVREIAAEGKVAFAAREHAELEASVVADVQPGDVVVALSNGAFGGIVARLSREAIFAPRAPQGAAQ